MKVANFTLLFALLLSISTIKININFASFTEIQDIQKDPYGKSLLETITLSLEKNDGNISTVQNLLNDLLFKLQSDQDKADAAWVIENKRLKDKIARLTTEIKELEVEILKLEEERQRYLKLIEKVKVNLKQYNAQLLENVKQLKVLTKKRQEDNQDFIRSQSEHLDIIAAIETVVKELRQLVGSISGKGKPAHVTEISQEKRDRLFKGFLQITQDQDEIALFIQTATTADQEALNKLINLLLKLKLSTQSSYNDDKDAEKKSESLYKVLKNALEEDIKKLNIMITTSENNLKLYMKKVVYLTTKIKVKTQLKNAKISERLATIKEREMKEKQYLSDKAEREKEMAIIRRLQEIVKKRLANMSEYLKKNTGS